MLLLILALWLETHSPTPLAAISAAEHSVLDAVGTKEKTIVATPATPSQHQETRATWQKNAIQPTRPIEPESASEFLWPNTRKTPQTNVRAPKPALRGPPPAESTQTNATPVIYARIELDSPVAPNKISVGEQPRDAWGKFMSKTNPGQRTPGLSAVDDFAEQAKLNGFEIAGREVSVQTPFGLRRYDVVIRDKVTGLRTGVEIKSSRSAFRRFEAQQEAADKWLKMQNGSRAVGKYDFKIDDTIKVLWEVP